MNATEAIIMLETALSAFVGKRVYSETKRSSLECRQKSKFSWAKACYSIVKHLVIHLFVAQGIHDVLCVAGCSDMIVLSPVFPSAQVTKKIELWISK